MYAVFLQQFQESFDQITTQHQINWATTEPGLSFFIDGNSEVATEWEAAREGVRERISAVIRDEINEKIGLLSLRETWAMGYENCRRRKSSTPYLATVSRTSS